MKELGVVRFRDFGDKKQAQQMHMFGRKLLGEMKQEMNAFGVKFLRRKIQLSSGIVFMISSNMIGLAPIDEIQVFVPQQNVVEVTKGKRDRIVGFMVTFNVKINALMYVYEPDDVAFTDEEYDPDAPSNGLLVEDSEVRVFLPTDGYDVYAGYDADGTRTDDYTFTYAPTTRYFMSADWSDFSYVTWTYIDEDDTQFDRDVAEGLHTWNKHRYASHIVNFKKDDSDLIGFGTVVDFNGASFELRNKYDLYTQGIYVGTAILPPRNNMDYRFSEDGKLTVDDGTQSFIMSGGSTYIRSFGGEAFWHDWTHPKHKLKVGDYRVEMQTNGATDESLRASVMNVELYGEQETYYLAIDFDMDDRFSPPKTIVDITVGEYFEDGNFMSMIKKDENL